VTSKSGWKVLWILLGACGCGGRNSADEADAAAGGADDANSTAPYAGTWDAVRSICPNGVYTELRDATWSLRLTDSSYTDVFSVQGCEATDAIALSVQSDRVEVDLSSGTQSCVPSPCQGNYSSTDTGSPAGVSYSILLCPKPIAAGRTATMTWIGNDMSYAVQGAACVQHFTKRP
jgi:hypothetical protein